MWNDGRSIVTRSGTAISIKGVTSVSRWKQKTTSTKSFATWSGKPCVQTRGASGIVALVEFAPCGARRHGVPHPLGVAFASPHRLAATCQPAANGSRAEVEALRCCVNRGRPFGDPNWVTDTAKQLGLQCTVRPLEDRRNNRRLATFTCTLWVLQI